LVTLDCEPETQTSIVGIANSANGVIRPEASHLSSVRT
jgi:hypothetical protein